MLRNHIRHRAGTPAAMTLACALLLGGCAGGSAKSGSSLADAELAVARAEQSRVGDYDAVDLRTARENLAAARVAANQKDKQEQSRWLAARAKVDAELGIARAEDSRLRAQIFSVQREIDEHKPLAAPAPTPVPAPQEQ